MNIERDAIYESVCQVVGRSVMLLNEKVTALHIRISQQF